MKRGPKKGGPLEHGTRCRCCDVCREHANLSARRARARVYARGMVYRHGKVVEPSPSYRRPPPRDYDRIAQVCTAAKEAGSSMILAVATDRDVTYESAVRIVMDARALGYPIPETDRTRGGRPRATPPPVTDELVERKAWKETCSVHLFTPEPWRQQRACIDVDPAVFFPGRGEHSEPAKAICASCPVRAECLNYALDNGIKFGIWGGLSEKQRRRIRRPISTSAHSSLTAKTHSGPSCSSQAENGAMAS